MAVDSLLARGFFGASRTANPVDDTAVVSSTVYTNNLLIPQDAIYHTSPVILWNSGVINSASTGVKVTHGFQARLPYNVIVSGRVRVRLKWTVVVGAGGASCSGRMGADLLRDGVAIPDLNKAKGPARDVNTGALTYTETLIIDVPASTNFGAGSTFDLHIFFEITGTGGATLQIGLYCDPNTIGDALICEVDVGHEGV